MDVIYKTCCGIDVHKKKLVACLRKGRKQEIKEFGAKTKDIKLMTKWLVENECEMIAMESTSIYWKPLVNIFEIMDLNYMVVNAKEFKAVPGRKTDILDSEWLADLLRHGLLKASYIPTREQRELREATRYRKVMTEERARALNRLQKMLEGANIKISSVVSDITGKTSMNLIDYILTNDEQMDEKIAETLIISRISASALEIAEAMDGIMTSFQKVLMKEVLIHLEELSKRIEAMDKIIDEYMIEYCEGIKKLEQIPGIGKKSAQIILAEIGLDMDRFPTAAHLASWAGVAPGNNESAGKRKSGRTRKGNKTLKSILTQVAKSSAQSKNSFFHAQYQRIAVKRGKNRATMAVAHSILIAIYYMLKNNEDFHDLGSDYYNQFNTDKKINSYLKKLEELGYKINANSLNQKVG
ncbi:MAG: IS110 family transposase [Turicibacter sp.]|jgi:transposase|nr:IS110 family transposase [Turicibacter sp.]